MAITTKTLNFYTIQGELQGSVSYTNPHVHKTSKNVIDGITVDYPSTNIEDGGSSFVSLDEIPANVYVSDFSLTEDLSGYASTSSYYIFVNSEWIRATVSEIVERINAGYRGQIKLYVYAHYYFPGSTYTDYTTTDMNSVSPASVALPADVNSSGCPVYKGVARWSASASLTLTYYPNVPAPKVYYGTNGDYQLCELRYAKNGEWTCPEVYYGISNSWERIDQH